MQCGREGVVVFRGGDNSETFNEDAYYWVTGIDTRGKKYYG